MLNTYLRKISIDDIRVKNKLILLMLSVLIPVVATNFVFYYSISKSAKEQQGIFLKETLQRVKVNVTNRMEECIHITDIFYYDNKLSILLMKKYQSQDEYYEVYADYLKDYINKYEKLYKQIYEMNIYVSNSSIVYGGGYYPIDDSVKNTAWYQNIVSSDNNIFIDVYMERNSESTLKPVRYFSILRKLDCLLYGSGVTKLIKLDVDYNFINKIIGDESKDADIFIVDNDNNIIFSNNAAYSSFTHDLISFDTYKLKPNSLMQSEAMTGVFSGYKVIIAAPESLIMNKTKNSNIYFLVITVMNLVLPSIIMLLISHSFKNRLETLSQHMKSIKHDKFSLNLVQCREGNDEIGQLIGDFNRMAVKMGELINDVYEASIQQKNLEISKKQAELNALQSQINPHFLFNILETIRMRSLLKGEAETSEIIKNLSKMLRRALNWDNDLVKLSEEIEFTMEFLKIEMYRFEDKLRYNIFIDDSVKDYKIPKLSIMTLVENACVHGIENIARIGTVTVKVKGTEDKITIVVSDDGIGMSDEKLHSLNAYLNNPQAGVQNSSQGIGIKNVYMRLGMFYGNQFSFLIKSREDEGTEFRIEIPCEIKRNDY